MKKLIYSPDYRDKIIRLKNDLDLKYGQTVRKKVLSEIDHHIQLLKTHNYLGISLREMYGIDCDYYYLYISPNLVFYEVEQESIHHDELVADWNIAMTGEKVFRIDPLK